MSLRKDWLGRLPNIFHHFYAQIIALNHLCQIEELVIGVDAEPSLLAFRQTGDELMKYVEVSLSDGSTGETREVEREDFLDGKALEGGAEW